MSITRRLNEEGIVETHARSPVELADALMSIRELEEFVRDGRLFEVVVTEGDGVHRISYEGGRTVAGSAVSFFQKLELVVIAMVAGNDASFGACRQIQSLMDHGDPRLRVSVFRDQTLAMEWLRQEKHLAEQKTAPISAGKQVASE